MTLPAQIGEWFFAVRPRNHGAGFIAWCAKSPHLANGPLQVDLGIEVHVRFGRTEDEALQELKAEVLS